MKRAKHKKAVEDFRAGKQARTDALLAKMRGGRNEFSILHGIMCMDMGQCDVERFPKWFDDSTSEGFSYQIMRSVFDTVRIAARLDEINGIAKEAPRCAACGLPRKAVEPDGSEVCGNRQCSHFRVKQTEGAK